MQLDEKTVCLCVTCGVQCVSAHDCLRQIAENEAAKPRSNMEYFAMLVRSKN